MPAVVRDFPASSESTKPVVRGGLTRNDILIPFLSVSPPNPSWPSTTPNGTTVATLQGYYPFPTGLLYLGDYIFRPPNLDNGGTYDIVLNHDAINSASLRIAPSGPGVGGAGGTIQHVTVAARTNP